MSSALPLVARRRFLAFLGLPVLLLLTRCTSSARRADEETYHGPFFSDGTGFRE
ncbi:MAG TPA: hypothetical protein VFO61_02700 [Alphaproteobacteria bacterium]|nr:hypothetical protein [Alphaproteobacteria bacterium]